MEIKRSDIKIKADPKRVIAKYLDFGPPLEDNRVGRLVRDVVSLEEDSVERLLSEVKSEFGNRHRHMDSIFLEHFQHVESLVPQMVSLSKNHQQLTGAYFSMEYSIRSAALFNPSIVAHPDQSGLSKDQKRFIMSLRAVGEGHISSIEFISGIVDSDGKISLEEESKFATLAHQDHSKTFQKDKLIKRTAIIPDFDRNIFDQLGPSFTKKQFESVPEQQWQDYDSHSQKILENIMDSNYDVLFHQEIPLNERVIFPKAKQESKGMEDVRFVEFSENGSSTYIGTYTAYDGHRISPQLIITKDFLRFKIRTMYGEAVQDKGFALFPEKINGQFVMLGRQGGENITIMFSDNLFQWETFENIMIPGENWGLTQLGNSGSPIKTEQGWLVLTHGVGPFRKYVISAI
ncbi:MAG: glycosidase, partial [Bacteroidetes bacterium]